VYKIVNDNLWKSLELLIGNLDETRNEEIIVRENISVFPEA